MHSGSDRPASGQSFEDTNKEPSTTNINKLSLKPRSSKIKFSREEFATQADSVENPPSASSNNPSPPASPTHQILSPVGTTIRATDSAVARMAGFQDNCDTRGQRINGRLDSKSSQKTETHVADGLLPNSIGNKSQTSSPSPSSLAFVDSCTKSKQISSNTNPNETETHKGIRLAGSGGTFFRRRSMRSAKQHTPLLSGVVEDADQITRHSLFSGAGMPAIQEAGTGQAKISSIELNELGAVSPGLSIPSGDKQFLESGASSVSGEHGGENFEKSGIIDSSRVSPYREKRGRVSSDEPADITVPMPSVVQTSCQDVKSWWMQQIHPHSLAAFGDRLDKSSSGGWEVSKESFVPSVVVTNQQAGRIRRRGREGGIDNEPESMPFSGGKRRFVNEPVA